jgi:hypothetical protein
MQTRRSDLHLFQIYYSAATRQSVEAPYTPLDNSSNERPDWREYWPIRRYFHERPPLDDDFYGFLSPAFRTKTRLDPATVLDFVAAHGDDADVMLFSPFFDQIAFFLNCWEQGALAHANGRRLFEDSLALVVPEFNLYETVGCSRNTVYCNYFIARGSFWLEWLARCERLFASAERADTALGRALAAPLDYKSQTAPAKVFAVERVASALLATQTRWRVRAYDPMRLPCSSSPISVLGPALAALDALKLAYLTEGRDQYLDAFFHLRAQFAQHPRPATAPSA